MNKIWANSGDGHVMEPADLWTSTLPKRLGDRAPRTEKSERHETVWVDGESVYRTLNQFAEAGRAPGAWDFAQRLVDMDAEGVVNQLLFPSAGLWVYRIKDTELFLACCQAYNDWMARDVMGFSERLDGVAMLPMDDVPAAVAELQRAAALGFRAVMLAANTEPGNEYAQEHWDPLWAAAEESGMVLAVHVGTGTDPRGFRGPGGVVTNYVETFIPGQRVVTHLTASGVLDRHPGLKLMIAEGGASWVPSLADRLDEGYRQHGEYATPKLSRLPGEIIFSQVYASFQHDRSAVPAMSAMGFQNVLWGDDYPHLEGTFGHSQETLHGLFDDAEPAVSAAIRITNYERLLGKSTAIPAAA